ncbi:MAG: AAA family ATPase, partial [Acidilobaceae archaeon]
MSTAEALVFAGGRGKTILLYGLALSMTKRGLRVAYFKPVGIGRRRLPSGSYIDTDAIAVTEALGLRDHLSLVNPIAITGGYLELRERSGEIAETIESSFRMLSAGRDAVLVEGYSAPESLAVVGLSSADIAVMLDARLVLVVDCRESRVIDGVVDKAVLYYEWASSRGARVAGVIFNAVPLTHMDRLKEGAAATLESKEVEVLGYIPYKPDLLAPRVREVVEILEAEVLEEGEGLYGVIESIVVAAASPEA